MKASGNAATSTKDTKNPTESDWLKLFTSVTGHIWPTVSMGKLMRRK